MSVTTSPEFHINQKNIPKWIDGLHYDDQAKSVQEYYDHELYKILYGITINGVYISPWLYYHLNHWIIPTDVKNNFGHSERRPMNPQLRDNEWYISENLNRAEKEGKGLFMFGTRRFGKSVILSSISSHSAKTKEGSSNTILGGSQADLNEIIKYLNYGIQYSPDFLKYEMVGTDWQNGMQFCTQYTNKKDIFSYTTILNVDQGELRSKEKGASGSPSSFIMDEVGKYNFKDVYLAARPSFETPFGLRCVPVLVGTGGQVELSADAQDFANSPETYGLIGMDWDLLNDRCAEPTWTTKKWTVFVPAQMSTQEGCVKEETTLGSYLNKAKGSELDIIKMQATNFELSTKNIKERLSFLEHSDRVAYNKERIYIPLDTDDCFLSNNINPFNSEYILRRISELTSSGDTGKTVEIFATPDKRLGYNLSTKSMPDFPFKGGNVDAPILIFEEPVSNDFNYRYVCGFDPYKHTGPNESISLGSFYIFKRSIDINDEYGGCIVASYTARPMDIDAFFTNCMLLQEAYGAMCLMENFDRAYIDFLAASHKQYRLLEAGEDLVQNIAGSKVKQNNPLGLPPTSKNKEMLMKILIKYANELIIIGVDERGDNIEVPGVHRIKDIGLLKEMLSYKHGVNCDRIIAFSHALALGRYYDLMNYIPDTIDRGSLKNNKRDDNTSSTKGFYTSSRRGYFK